MTSHPDSSSPLEPQPNGGLAPAESGPAWRTAQVLPAAIGLALVYWLMLILLFPVFRVPVAFATYAGPAPTAEESAAEAAAGVRARGGNAGLAGALLGLSFAVLITLTARTERPWRGRLLRSVVVGVGVGCMAGVLAHLLAESQRVKQLEPLQANVVSQAGLMALLGAAAGLIGSIQSPLGRGGIFSGCIGGFLAALIYPLLTAFLIPSANTSLVVPRDTWSQLIWVLLIFVMISSTAVGVSTRRKRRTGMGDGPT